MIGVMASSEVVATLVDPIVLSAAAASVATATADIGIAKTALELGGADPLDVGDLLVAAPKANATTQTWVSKAGDPAWTLFSQNNTTCAAAVLWRIWTGAEPATLTFTRSVGTSGAELDIWRIKAGTFEVATPIDVASFIAASGASAVIPSVTTTVGRSMLCQTVARMVASTTETWPTFPTPSKLFDVTAATNNLQTAGGYEQLTTAAATGSRTWTQSGTGAVRGTMFAVRSKP